MPDLRRFFAKLFGSDPGASESAHGFDSPASRAVDAKPVAIAGTTRTVTAHGFTVLLDLTTQVLAVTAPEDRDVVWDQEPGRAVEAPIIPTLSGMGGKRVVSAAVLAHKAKIFDDGLYAAVEIAAQQGAGRHGGKARLLAALGRVLGSADAGTAEGAQRVLLAAARLGDIPLEGCSPAAQALAERAAEEFLGDELHSKPIAFYTWSDDLTRVFRQDRCLQQELTGSGGTEALVRTLRADPELREIYVTQLRLAERLTNPFAKPDLRGLLGIDPSGAAGSDVRFFPPSVSHETELVKKLYGDSPIPEGFVLADEMVRGIRSGELDLTPRAESGWYDHQTWALEPLVIPDRMPEAPKLMLDDGYEKLLVDLFKGLLTLTRETHVKQLEMPLVGCAAPGPPGQKPHLIIRIAPELSAEPVPTFYLRRALGYRFVRAVLEETFGGDALATMHRLTSAGPVEVPLDQELADTEALFLGAHVRVSRELGLHPDEATGDEEVANAVARRFTSWAGSLDVDSDLGQDVRAMVPVFYDIGRGRTKVWLFLGWAQRKVSVSFGRHPGVTILDPKGKPAADPPIIRWEAIGDEVLYPVTAEVYVDRILNRDEFRALCDQHGTRSAILRALDAGG